MYKTRKYRDKLTINWLVVSDGQNEQPTIIHSKCPAKQSHKEGVQQWALEPVCKKHPKVLLIAFSLVLPTISRGFYLTLLWIPVFVVKSPTAVVFALYLVHTEGMRWWGELLQSGVIWIGEVSHMPGICIYVYVCNNISLIECIFTVISVRIIVNYGHVF